MIGSIISVGVFALIVGFIIGYSVCSQLAGKKSRLSAASARARRGDAEKEAKGIIREAEIQARTEVLKARESFENSMKEQRKVLNETMSSLHQREQVLSQREDNLDRKAEVLDKKQDILDKKATQAENALAEAKEREAKAEQTARQAELQLQKLAAMTRDQAKDTLFQLAKQDIQGELATFLLREKERAEKEANRSSQKLLLGAMERYSASHAVELTTRSVSLPSNEEKGHIIGREGRNIRALEQATGCSFLIDDTPETVVISGADPIRREIAARTLQQLLASGRIQPQRIEETAASVTASMEDYFLEIGQQTASEVNVNISSAAVLRTLGRLRFRTSFSQPVLTHAVETAFYAGMLAGEMGLDAEIARKAGLLHDIGKALDQNAEGPHAIVGADFLRKNGEAPEIVDAVAGHHKEVENVSIYAVLVSIADTLSSARPGARQEAQDRYINHIEKLEKLALSFPGVTRAFAVQSGRDLRILVDPEKIDDRSALLLARNICSKIQSEALFPGQVRVTVIRELRCIEYAH